MAGDQRESMEASKPTPGEERLRVVFVAQVDPSGRSGQNVATKEIASALARDPGIELTIICPDPVEGWPEELRKAEHVCYLPRKRPGSWFWHIRSQWALFRHLRGWLQAGRGDAIVARLGPSLFLPPLLAKRSGVPYFLLIRGLRRGGGGGVQGLLRRGVPEDLVARFSVRRALSVFVAFQEVEDRVLRLAGSEGVDVELFPNAVNPELFPTRSLEEARREIGVDLELPAFLLGFVGSLRDRHGLFELLEAGEALIAEGMDLHLLMVGEGPLLNELRGVVQKRGMEERVHFTGHVPHHVVAAYISACDVLYGVVHPDLPSNPIKCQEYLVCERPIITSRKAELQFVEEVGAGVAIEALEGTQIAEAVRLIASRGPEERAAMGRRGRQHVLEHHTWSRLVELIRARVMKARGREDGLGANAVHDPSR